MRFTKKFSRRVGADGSEPVLGSDEVPKTQPSTRDAEYSQVFMNIQGWPAHRLAVACKFEGEGSAPPVEADLYVWEDTTEAWYRIPQPAKVLLTPGEISFFDVVGLVNPPHVGGRDDLGASAGHLQAFLLVRSPEKSDPKLKGRYTFAMASDLTCLAV